LVPAIKETWPDGNTDTIIVQQDGCCTNQYQCQKPVFVVAATEGNWNIILETQSAHSSSPDTNHDLDLSFFRALQSRQWDHGYATNMDKLAHCTAQARSPIWHIKSLILARFTLGF
jgi:hypothetical protein